MPPDTNGSPIVLTAAQETFLDQLAADQLETPRCIEGNELRLLGLDPEGVVATLPPGLVLVGGRSPPAECYKLTLRGWLASRYADQISDAVKRILAYIQKALRQDRRKASFDWAEIRQGTGAEPSEYGIYCNALDAGRMWMASYTLTSGSGEHNLTIRRPPHDELMDAMTWQSVEDVLRHREELDRRLEAANAAIHAESVIPSEGQEVQNSVFVVHGHDEDAKEDLFSFVRTLGLQVITFDHARSMGSGSQSNHEIVRNGIEAATAVIILFTPDEIAQRRLPGDPQIRHQPRPNVLFEAGWAFGAHQHKAIVVEVGMVHAVSDIAGINNVRMRDGSSLNDLASRLEAAGCVLDRNDTGWSSAARYPALFQRPPSPPTVEGPPAIESPGEDLDDESLIEILRDKLPDKGGFFTFKQLDMLANVPSGTAKRLGEAAAKAAGILGRATAGGLRLKPIPIFGPG